MESKRKRRKKEHIHIGRTINSSYNQMKDRTQSLCPLHYHVKFVWLLPKYSQTDYTATDTNILNWSRYVTPNPIHSSPVIPTTHRRGWSYSIYDSGVVALAAGKTRSPTPSQPCISYRSRQPDSLFMDLSFGENRSRLGSTKLRG